MLKKAEGDEVTLRVIGQHNYSCCFLSAEGHETRIDLKKKVVPILSSPNAP